MADLDKAWRSPRQRVPPFRSCSRRSTRFIAGCGSASRGPGYIYFPIGGAFDEQQKPCKRATRKAGRIAFGYWRRARPTKRWTPRSMRWRRATPPASGWICCRAPRTRAGSAARSAGRRATGCCGRSVGHAAAAISVAGAVSSFAAGIWWASEAWPARRPAAGKPPCVISWREARQGRDGRHSRPRLPRRLR